MGCLQTDVAPHFNNLIEEIHMSILDKVIAAVTPPESEEARREAREKLRRLRPLVIGCRWCWNITCTLRRRFAAVKAANNAGAQAAAQKKLRSS